MELEEKLIDILDVADEQYSFFCGDAQGMMKLYKEKGDEKGEKRNAEWFKEIMETLEVIEVMEAHIGELSGIVGKWMDEQQGEKGNEE